MENQVHQRKNAIQELVRGRELTCQLNLLLTPHNSKQSSFIARDGGGAEDLVAKIFSTFTQTISLLNTTTTTTTTTNVDSSSSDEASQLSLDALPLKSDSSSRHHRPGCNNKRKRVASQSWVKDSPIKVDNGHSWRKYGQKTILESELPRHYYRCTQKFDQKCQATKQVQMLQDHPSQLYRTTYSARHTCNNINHFTTLHGEHFQVDPIADSDSSHLISFNNRKTSTATTPFLASLSGSLSAVKQQQELSLSGVASCGHQTPIQGVVSSQGDNIVCDMLAASYEDHCHELSGLGHHHHHHRHGDVAAACGSSVNTAADDEKDIYDRSFIQMMIMDSVDDFGCLLV